MVPFGDRATSPSRSPSTAPSREPAAGWTAATGRTTSAAICPPACAARSASRRADDPRRRPRHGQSGFAFSTGGPAIIVSLPAKAPGIDEEQAFVLTLDGEATRDSVAAPTRLRDRGHRRARRRRADRGRGARGAHRRALLAHAARAVVVLQARQRFPNTAKVRLVWGAGIASPSGVATEQDQMLEFRARPAFTATFPASARRRSRLHPAHADRACAFGAGRLGAGAAIALVGPDGRRRARRRRADRRSSSSRLPAGRSPSRRPSASSSRPACATTPAARSPTPTRSRSTVQTAPFPPLAKFAARFGILESKADPALPVTIRNLEPAVQGAPPPRGSEARAAAGSPTG